MANDIKLIAFRLCEKMNDGLLTDEDIAHDTYAIFTVLVDKCDLGYYIYLTQPPC